MDYWDPAAMGPVDTHMHVHKHIHRYIHTHIHTRMHTETGPDGHMAPGPSRYTYTYAHIHVHVHIYTYLSKPNVHTNRTKLTEWIREFTHNQKEDGEGGRTSTCCRKYMQKLELPNIHTHIFHVAIWPVLPYTTSHLFTYIGLHK